MTAAPSKDRLALLDAMIEKGASDPFVWYARAMELRSRERLDEALTAFGEVRSRFPDYVPTYLMAAQVCQSLEHVERASEWLRQGIERAQVAGDMHALSELRDALSHMEASDSTEASH